MKYRKKPDHYPENYLKAILESMQFYNVISRADIANWLFEGFKKTKQLPNKKISRKALVLEIISKWIQQIEDLALLSLMFAGNLIKYEGRPIINDGRKPYEIYSYCHTQDVLKLFVAAKRGLSKTAISEIYAIKRAQELLREGLISQNEYSYFKKEIDKLILTTRDNFTKLARVYSKRRSRGKPNYGTLVEIYFNTKHGFKLLHLTPTSKKLWSFDSEDLILIKRVKQLPWGRKVMTVGRFKKFTASDIKVVVDQINKWSKVIKEVVDAQLAKLNDPNFIVPLIRSKKTEEIIKREGLKIGRNDPCPCGALDQMTSRPRKFKKCCALVISV